MKLVKFLSIVAVAACSLFSLKTVEAGCSYFSCMAPSCYKGITNCLASCGDMDTLKSQKNACYQNYMKVCQVASGTGGGVSSTIINSILSLGIVDTSNCDAVMEAEGTTYSPPTVDDCVNNNNDVCSTQDTLNACKVVAKQNKSSFPGGLLNPKNACGQAAKAAGLK